MQLGLVLLTQHAITTPAGARRSGGRPIVTQLR
jgi:hypothetical protein